MLCGCLGNALGQCARSGSVLQMPRIRLAMRAQRTHTE